MIRENKAFIGFLTKFQNKAKDEDVVVSFTVKHVEEGDNQMFLTSYAQKCNQENVDAYFRYPVKWKNINIEANYRFKMEFDEVELECTLKSIRVARSFKKGMEVFTYQLEFEKAIETENDAVFSTYLNQKEMGDDGKKRLIQYPVYLTPLEQLLLQ